MCRNCRKERLVDERHVENNMTGWTKSGKGAHQREKIFAIIREQSRTVYEITGECWHSSDPALFSIKSPTIRRCLQELRDHTPQLAVKDEVSGKWIGFELS